MQYQVEQLYIQHPLIHKNDLYDSQYIMESITTLTFFVALVPGKLDNYFFTILTHFSKSKRFHSRHLKNRVETAFCFSQKRERERERESERERERETKDFWETPSNPFLIYYSFFLFYN